MRQFLSLPALGNPETFRPMVIIFYWKIYIYEYIEKKVNRQNFFGSVSGSPETRPGFWGSDESSRHLELEVRNFLALVKKASSFYIHFQFKKIAKVEKSF